MEIDSLRNAIDDVDTQLLELISKRYDLATRLGKVKRALNIPVYDPVREHEIMERLQLLNAGKLPEKTMLAAWRQDKRFRQSSKCGRRPGGTTCRIQASQHKPFQD